MPVELERLRQLAADFSSTPDESAWSPLSVSLAEAFGWRGGAPSIRVVPWPAPGMGLTRTRLGSEPGGLFAAVPRASREAMEQAALVAYHAAAPWGLVADADGVVVFSPRWVRDSDWYYLPRIRWQDTEAQARLLEVITPGALSSGEGDHIAAQVYQPDRQVRQVDDALVDRLDYKSIIHLPNLTVGLVNLGGDMVAFPRREGTRCDDLEQARLCFRVLPTDSW